jgi:hypothetical protein
MFLQEMDYLPAGVLERKIDGSLLPRTGIYILVVTGDRYRKTLPIFCAATGGKGIRAQGAFSE